MSTEEQVPDRESKRPRLALGSSRLFGLVTSTLTKNKQAQTNLSQADIRRSQTDQKLTQKLADERALHAATAAEALTARRNQDLVDRLALDLKRAEGVMEVVREYAASVDVFVKTKASPAVYFQPGKRYLDVYQQKLSTHLKLDLTSADVSRESTFAHSPSQGSAMQVVDRTDFGFADISVDLGDDLVDASSAPLSATETAAIRKETEDAKLKARKDANERLKSMTESVKRLSVPAVVPLTSTAATKPVIVSPIVNDKTDDAKMFDKAVPAPVVQVFVAPIRPQQDTYIAHPVNTVRVAKAVDKAVPVAIAKTAEKAAVQVANNHAIEDVEMRDHVTEDVEMADVIIGTPASPTTSLTTTPVAKAPVVTTPLAKPPLATKPVVTSPLATKPVATSPVVTASAVTSPIITEPLANAPLIASPIESLSVEAGINDSVVSAIEQQPASSAKTQKKTPAKRQPAQKKTPATKKTPSTPMPVSTRSMRSRGSVEETPSKKSDEISGEMEDKAE